MTTDDTVQVHRGALASGGMLNVYLVAPDAFGVLGAPAIRGLANAPNKSLRGKAAKRIEKLLRDYAVIESREQIISVSLGCQRNGTPHLVVVCEQTLAEGRV